LTKIPPGKGIELKKAMDRFVASIQTALREAFESEDYTKRREATVRKVNQERDDIISNINSMAQEAGFIVQPSPIGLQLVPVSEGKPLSDQEFAQLPPALQKKIQQERDALNSKIGDAFRPLQDIVRKVDAELQALNRQVAGYAIAPYLNGIRDMFKDNEEVLSYLKDVETDILDIVPVFLTTPQQPQQPGAPVLDPTRNYKVNLIVDNSELKGAPAEIENNPTYPRLFGYTEKEARFGALVTDYTMIKAGSALKANGGYLIIPVERMFQDPLVWEGLKQTLTSGQLEMEDFISRMGYMVTKSLRPEPIPFTAKVIIVGNPEVYAMLFSLDPDFKELFKVKAEFDTTMEWNDKNVGLYASFICGLVNKEDLLHLDSSALGALIEHSARLAEDQKKLSTQFALIADIVREASFYAAEDGSPVITREHINKQLEEKTYRSNMIQKKIEELIRDNVFLVDIEGAKIGQVNGLAVLSVGDYAFGRPSRITASVGVGREGVVDIERQAQMSGATHTKGVLIIAGFLNGRYATDVPLSLSARLVFEQSYSGVDGDSASSTELYALLSALSEVPIKQNIAVTGSVNQKGEVQAIGGVNEKVEGYFEVCKAKGLTGEQGCMIPESNVRNLMLKDEVIEAIKDGQFHLYPVKTVDEGIEVLTGVQAGAARPDGTYEKGTINYLVKQRLEEMAATIKEYHP
jgi:lon-related putative ATP-dependent protease